MSKNIHQCPGCFAVEGQVETETGKFSCSFCGATYSSTTSSTTVAAKKESGKGGCSPAIFIIPFLAFWGFFFMGLLSVFCAGITPQFVNLNPTPGHFMILFFIFACGMVGVWIGSSHASAYLSKKSKATPVEATPLREAEPPSSL